MWFSLLRRYFIDMEFEKLKNELIETKQVLGEYREFLTEFQNKAEETEKVDPDFLNLMWASVGFAVAVFVSAGQKAVELKENSLDPALYLWIILSIFSLYFIF